MPQSPITTSSTRLIIGTGPETRSALGENSLSRTTLTMIMLSDTITEQQVPQVHNHQRFASGLHFKIRMTVRLIAINQPLLPDLLMWAVGFSQITNNRTNTQG